MRAAQQPELKNEKNGLDDAENIGNIKKRNYMVIGNTMKEKKLNQKEGISTRTTAYRL